MGQLADWPRNVVDYPQRDPPIVVMGANGLRYGVRDDSQVILFRGRALTQNLIVRPMGWSKPFPKRVLNNDTCRF